MGNYTTNATSNSTTNFTTNSTTNTAINSAINATTNSTADPPTIAARDSKALGSSSFNNNVDDINFEYTNHCGNNNCISENGHQINLIKIDNDKCGQDGHFDNKDVAT